MELGERCKGLMDATPHQGEEGEGVGLEGGMEKANGCCTTSG